MRNGEDCIVLEDILIVEIGWKVVNKLEINHKFKQAAT